MDKLENAVQNFSKVGSFVLEIWCNPSKMVQGFEIGVNHQNMKWPLREYRQTPNWVRCFKVTVIKDALKIYHYFLDSWSLWLNKPLTSHLTFYMTLRDHFYFLEIIYTVVYIYIYEYLFYEHILYTCLYTVQSVKGFLRKLNFDNFMSCHLKTCIRWHLRSCCVTSSKLLAVNQP